MSRPTPFPLPSQPLFFGTPSVAFLPRLHQKHKMNEAEASTDPNLGLLPSDHRRKSSKEKKKKKKHKKDKKMAKKQKNDGVRREDDNDKLVQESKSVNNGPDSNEGSATKKRPRLDYANTDDDADGDHEPFDEEAGDDVDDFSDHEERDRSISANDIPKSSIETAAASAPILEGTGSGGVKANFFATGSNDVFSKLPLSEKMQTALAEMEYTRMTQIQGMAIPPILEGKDVIGAAPTGSGKTLAFVVPCLELLHKTKFTTKNGTGCLIISPTRELALQIYGVVSEICSHGKFSQTHGLIMGGANRRTEADRLIKGVNIVVATPGRLLDHLLNTTGFIIRNLLALCIDEADRILEEGFEDDLRSILKVLPKERRVRGELGLGLTPALVAPNISLLT
jgi:ATP-dependent RNA helicase DDX18/HAS1